MNIEAGLPGSVRRAMRGGGRRKPTYHQSRGGMDYAHDLFLRYGLGEVERIERQPRLPVGLRSLLMT